ncbi:MAG: 3-deoxy-7-phosphoheptulonate synthase [Chitinivibrionales bacterium]|nr:3-deoxy-7-phosphoheptulonate synthase [Chitinivibrionales bacterium]
MIIHLSKSASPEQKETILNKITSKGFNYEISHGSTGIDIIGVLGDLSGIEESYFAEAEGVEKVIRISKPYKQVSREFSAATKIIEIDGIKIGGEKPVMMAGPCSVESESQIMAVADYVAELGIPFLRGGAYKPRTSPYSFQGMGVEGLKILDKARKKYGLKIVTEATGMHCHILEDGSVEKKSVLDNVIDYTDIIQIGTRNMKSYGFLQALAMKTRESKIPILLKRGDSSTLKDFLLAAEYIVSNGNPNVILCLRGIKTFEESKFQRATADIGAVAVLKQESNLPVLFDPSHSTGYRNRVYAMSMAALAAGADGLLIETHNDPSSALCDGEQSITREQLAAIIKNAAKIKDAAG